MHSSIAPFTRPRPDSSCSRQRARDAASQRSHSVAGPPPRVTAGRFGGGGEPGPRRRVDAGAHIAVVGTWVALLPAGMLFTGLILATLALRRASSPRAAFPELRLMESLALCLLLGSAALHRARSAARATRSATRWLLAAIGAGALFVAGLAWMWRRLAERGLVAGHSSIESCFYVLTGAHALHVTAGMAVLAALVRWPPRGRRGTPLEVAVEAAAVYWNFVTGMWLVLLAVWAGPL